MRTKTWTLIRAQKAIFFEIIVHRLPIPKEEALSLRIVDNIDLDSYRLEKKRDMSIVLANQDGEVETPQAGLGRKAELEVDSLDNIIANLMICL